MQVFGKNVSISAFKAIVATLVIVISSLAYFYFSPDFIPPNTKTSSLAGGLLAGCIVALAQFLLSWYEYANIEKFKSLKILDVRTNRVNRTFYENLIRSSNTEIAVMGVTADRFLEHFADVSSGLTV